MVVAELDPARAEVACEAMHDFVEADRRLFRFESRSVVFYKPYSVRSSLGRLPRGTWEWTLELSNEEPARGDEMARLEVTQAGRTSFTTVDVGAKRLALRFDTDGSNQTVLFQLTSRSATPLIITRSQLRQDL